MHKSAVIYLSFFLCPALVLVLNAHQNERFDEPNDSLQEGYRFTGKLTKCNFHTWNTAWLVKYLAFCCCHFQPIYRAFLHFTMNRAASTTPSSTSFPYHFHSVFFLFFSMLFLLIFFIPHIFLLAHPLQSLFALVWVCKPRTELKSKLCGKNNNKNSRRRKKERKTN